MEKKDFYYSLIVGGIISVFVIIFLSTFGSELSVNYSYLYKLRWLLLVLLPLGALYVISITTRFKQRLPSLFQFSKFCLVGMSNTLIDLGVLNLLMFISGNDKGIYFTLFKTVSITFAIFSSYLWNKFWTFENEEFSALLNQFIRFLIVMAGALIIDVSVATVFVNAYADNSLVSSRIVANIGAILALLVTTFWNFFGLKLFVFKKALESSG